MPRLDRCCPPRSEGGLAIHRLSSLAALAWLALVATGCNDGAGPGGDSVEVGTVSVTAVQDSLITGGSLQFSAVVREVSDTLLFGWPVAWTTTDTTLAVVSSTGTVTAVRPGAVRVIATADSGTPASDTFALRLLPRATSVTISPRPAALVISDSIQLSGVVQDSTGAVLTGRPLQWGSGGTGNVNQQGLLRATSGGSVLVTASVEGQIDSFRVATNVDGSFAAIASGDQHTCALTISGRAYCWGNGFVGQLGNTTLALSFSPLPVDPALHFTSISAGGSHSCAITATATVYCWGYNSYGQAGTSTDRICGLPCRAVETPVLVAGLPAMASVHTGLEHSCAVTSAGRAWCWGANWYAQLGRGASDSGFNFTPDSVPGVSGVSDITGGYAHSCAIGSAGSVECWGGNTLGQLGLGTTDSLTHVTPTVILGALAFVRLTAGQSHTCGVTTSQEGWCWGQATDGKLGNGSVSPPIQPAPVIITGSHSWRSLSANAEHTCGVTTADEAYCWGNSSSLQTGNSGGATPQLVSGGLAFSTLAAGHYHSCGLTTTGVAYCWGIGLDGQLGSSITSSGVPVLVTGQP